MIGYQEDPNRRGSRTPAGVAVSFQDAGQVVHCTAVNVSKSGAVLAGSLAVPAGDPLELTLKTPGGQLAITLPARILRIAAGELAVEWIDLDETRRDRLEVFLARLLEAPQSGPLDGLRPGAPPLEVKKALESIPLTQRIALAQRAEARHREFFRQDQHPSVLDAVVRNPGFTLPEALAIAAHLPLPVPLMELIAADPRFRTDEELRIALACHPKVPFPLAEKLTADLKAPQIRKLLAKAGVNPTLRDKLFKKLARG